MKRLLSVAILILFAPGLVGASDDILTTAASNGSFNTLVSLVVAADLDDALQGDGEFTVFAPTDEAFAKLPKETLESLLRPENREQLANILKYHVVSREISVPKKKPSHPLKSTKTLLGSKIRFERNGSAVKVNDANVVIRNIHCNNGLIQVIDSVLLPPSNENTIAGVAKKAGNFATLLAAAEAAGLTDALTGDGPLTVFAPTDDAFKSLPKGTVKELLKPENKDQLATILKYHVIAGKVNATAAVKAGKAKTLAGSSVKITIREGRLAINDSSVIANDVEASNGLIHVIDKVLMPPQPHTSTSTSTSDQQDSEIVLSATWKNPISRDSLKADRIVIRCSGGGSVNLTNVMAKEIITTISGGGSVSLQGRATNHSVQVNGGASLRARELMTEKTDVHVNSGGKAEVYATNRLAASANSYATLRYVDTGAKIQKTINAKAEFVPLNISTSTSRSHH